MSATLSTVLAVLLPPPVTRPSSLGSRAAGRSSVRRNPARHDAMDRPRAKRWGEGERAKPTPSGKQMECTRTRNHARIRRIAGRARGVQSSRSDVDIRSVQQGLLALLECLWSPRTNKLSEGTSRNISLLYPSGDHSRATSLELVTCPSTSTILSSTIRSKSEVLVWCAAAPCTGIEPVSPE